MTSFESTKSEIVGSALGKALGLSTSSTWNDVITKIKGVADRGTAQTSNTIGGANDYFALNSIPEGYYRSAGYSWAPEIRTNKSNFGTASAGNVLSGVTFSSQNGIKQTGTMVNRGALNWSGSNTTYTVPAGYYSGGTLNSKTSYTNGYNAGVTAGTPNMISGAHWVIDSCNASSWTCSTAGMYLVYVYGYVKVSSRYVTPTVTFSGGTKKAEGTISSATADVRKGWIYQFSSGNKVSCSWSENHGTYSWRNGFLIIRIK